MTHPTDQQAVLSLLLRHWQEISAIETPYQLQVGQGDTRPRIDFFHDAIRAFTDPIPKNHPSDRLTVEALAYDLRVLRYIAEMPLATLSQDHTHGLSPHTDLVPTGPGLVSTPPSMTRDIKKQLARLYEQYAVLFAALLKLPAEEDAETRIQELNEEVETINAIIHALSAQAPINHIIAQIQHLADEGLKQELLRLLPRIQGKTAGAYQTLIDRLRAKIKKNDARIQGIDGAMHQYATTQLAIYESGRDMLKNMAGKGMNLVGQFVESSLRKTQAERGR